MGRILSIDFGSKRCGLAVTDPMQIIARGLETVAAGELLDYLENYFSKEDVDTVVIGEPRDMGNNPSGAAAGIEGFIRRLKKKFPSLHIERVDERFTSEMAKKTMIDSGLKKKDRRNKELVDEISAVIILQSYLYKLENNNK